jgi:hypothetical protein
VSSIVARPFRKTGFHFCGTCSKFDAHFLFSAGDRVA